MIPSPSNKRGFSLIEVVVAMGIFALAIVAVFGLLTPIARDSASVIETGVAVRLGESVNRELERVGGANVSALGSNTLYLVATADGSRVLRTGDAAVGATGSHPAENTLNNTPIAGIAQRDRFYLIEVKLMERDGPDANHNIHSSTYGSDAGAVPVQVKVTWPLYIPTSAPPTTAPSGSWDAADVAGTLVPAANRSVYLFTAGVRR